MLIDLNTGELHNCPFSVNLDRCDESWKTLDDLSDRYKTEEVNLKVFTMITRFNNQNHW